MRGQDLRNRRLEVLHRGGGSLASSRVFLDRLFERTPLVHGGRSYDSPGIRQVVHPLDFSFAQLHLFLLALSRPSEYLLRIMGV